MNILSQEARKRQAVVKYAIKKNNKSAAAEQYGVSLSSVKRWCKRYDGSTWQSLLERSHKPRSPHPRQHTTTEEMAIKKAFSLKFFRYGWDGVYDELIKNHTYTRSFGGMYNRAKKMGLGGKVDKKKPPRKNLRRYPELSASQEPAPISRTIQAGRKGAD